MQANYVVLRTALTAMRSRAERYAWSKKVMASTEEFKKVYKDLFV